MGELGFFGMRYPEDVGGSGADVLSYCLAVEELARGSLSVGVCVATPCFRSFNRKPAHRGPLSPDAKGW